MRAFFSSAFLKSLLVIGFLNDDRNFIELHSFQVSEDDRHFVRLLIVHILLQRENSCACKITVCFNFPAVSNFHFRLNFPPPHMFPQCCQFKSRLLCFCRGELSRSHGCYQGVFFFFMYIKVGVVAAIGESVPSKRSAWFVHTRKISAGCEG